MFILYKKIQIIFNFRFFKILRNLEIFLNFIK